jgi:hypothetical protein
MLDFYKILQKNDNSVCNFYDLITPLIKIVIKK